ncbi:DUF6734 family protein [Chitinophaga sp. GbtcB8]|uniref:DUF6734 family protein n=1 Tax=Chitinophaga sp. GbtcB8 TaxID=2824753 RepID=UPI0034CEEBE1
MKIVQSFWTYPMVNSNPKKVDLRLNGGWPVRLYNYFSWSYSCLCLRRHYQDVEIVTDTFGRELLIDKLRLPYTRIVMGLDDFKEANSLLWALGKIQAYSLQDEPFIHIDGDIYIYDRFRPDMEKADIIAQNIETGFRYGGDLSFEYMPEYMEGVLDRGGDLHAFNLGIFGGCNTELIKAFSKEAFTFIDNNYDKITAANSGAINSVFEQVLLYCFLQGKELDIACLFPPQENFPASIGHFHPNDYSKQYIHLLGSLKESFYHYKTLESRLEKEFPDYYRNIIDLYSRSEI